MNQTIDDVAGVLFYSEGNWRQQPPNDAIAGQYSGGTYHVTQENGANMTLTFQGIGLYIYGSKGPGHANFSVRWAGFLQQGSAWDSSFQTKQLLWSRVFPTDGSEGGADNTHTVTLVSATNGSNTWLDVDYLTISTPGRSQPGLGSYSSTNAGLLSAIATSGSTSTGSGSTNQAAQTSITDSLNRPSHNIGTLAAAITLGALLLILIGGLFMYRFLKRRFDSRRVKERNLRRRDPTVTSDYFSHDNGYSQTHPSTHGSVHPSMTQRSLFTSGSIISNMGTQAITELSDHDIIRQEHNQSAMGWSTRTAVDQNRPPSPGNSIHKPPIIASGPPPHPNSYHPHRPSGAPPSYKPPQTPLESEESPTDTYVERSPPASHPEARQTPGHSHPPSSFHMPSAAARENIFRMAPPTWVAPLPRRPDAPGTSGPYDDGDSRRTNFLQV